MAASRRSTPSHEGKRLTVYVGAASGGVWKSVNGGTTYKPVFDKQPVQSIGAITIDPKNPKTVWVGTGEAWTRNSVSIGDGIYKSTDGGDNWTNMGLNDTERIAKILVDPSDTRMRLRLRPRQALERQRRPRRLQDDRRRQDLGEDPEGRQPLDRLLDAVDGPAEPENDLRRPVGLPPQRLDIPLGRRRARTRRAAAALFKSTDGGATWTDLDEKTANGLPAKPWGRVAVTVAPSKPNVVYAFIEAAPPKNGLYRSDDGGRPGRRSTAASTWSGGPSTSPI